MKHNIDLTENFDFNRHSGGRLVPYIAEKVFSKIPWKFSKSDEFWSDEQPLIVCGTGNFRKQFNQYSDLNSGDFCDCCGSPFRIPWRFEIGVCKTCHDYYITHEFNRHLRVPWSRSTNVPIQNSQILTGF